MNLMGLDTTHNCWHGPYSAFMRWRRAIAEAAGFPPLDIMEGFFDRDRIRSEADLPFDPHSWTRSSMILGMWRRGHLPLAWEALRSPPGGPDPRLISLLRHSDCDGEILAAECAPIADALEALLPRLDATVPHPGIERAVYDGVRAATVRFIAGLRDAAAKRENVVFR